MTIMPPLKDLPELTLRTLSKEKFTEKKHKKNVDEKHLNW